MKFIILSILGVFAFRTSGVSADCCQTSEDCPEGYELVMKINKFNKCVFKINGKATSCDIVNSSMAFCSGGDVPTPTPPTSAPSTPTCCKASWYCPEGYESLGKFYNNTLCGVKIDGTTSCDPFISSGDSSMAFCSIGNYTTTTPPTSAPTSGVSADCCQTSEDCPEGYERFGEALGLTTNGSG